MSIFRGHTKPQAITPDYTGLQIQTAVSALPIPIVWGMSKLAPNVIWYNNFKAIAQGNNGSGGGKGLFHSNAGTTQYDYTADVIMALCEGPIVGINQIWRGLESRAGAVQRRSEPAGVGVSGRHRSVAGFGVSQHGLCGRGEL